MGLASFSNKTRKRGTLILVWSINFFQPMTIHLIFPRNIFFISQVQRFHSFFTFQYINLCREARKHALDIVEAFGHPKICVGAPIAGIPNDDAPWAYYPDSDMPGTKSRLWHLKELFLSTICQSPFLKWNGYMHTCTWKSTLAVFCTDRLCLTLPVLRLL